jgi:hypothetical protein
MKVYVLSPMDGSFEPRAFRNKESKDDFLKNGGDGLDYLEHLCEIEVSENYKKNLEARNQKARQKKEEKREARRKIVRERALSGDGWMVYK